MRSLIVRIFDYSLDGLIPQEDTAFSRFCQDLPDDVESSAFTDDFELGAELYLMGRVHYEHLAEAMRPLSDHPWAERFTAAPKVVFSRTLTSTDWANTLIANGDLTETVAALKSGGDGYLLASGGVGFWRELARLDLVDEYRITLVPHLGGADGTRLFDHDDESRPFDLVASTAFANGTVGLQYRRRRD